MHCEASPSGDGLPSLEQGPVVPVHAQLLALGCVQAACPAAESQRAERVRSTDTMAVMGIIQVSARVRLPMPLTLIRSPIAA